MKKHGFTLAEVLITMTIIGVVAALTTPALFNNANNAQVGPKLAKIKSTIENANQQMMQDEEVNSINSLVSDLFNNSFDLVNARDRYIDILSEYMRLEDAQVNMPQYSDYYGNKINGYTPYYTGALMFQNTIGTGRRLITPDGVRIYMNTYTNPNDQLNIAELGISMLYVDINGNREPNRFGKDMFAFILHENGMLRPYGDFDANGDGKDYRWQELCNPDLPEPVSPDKQVAGLACTATIFANNLRVTYDE